MKVIKFVVSLLLLLLTGGCASPLAPSTPAQPDAIVQQAWPVTVRVLERVTIIPLDHALVSTNVDDQTAQTNSDGITTITVPANREVCIRVSAVSHIGAEVCGVLTTDHERWTYYLEPFGDPR